MSAPSQKPSGDDAPDPGASRIVPVVFGSPENASVGCYHLPRGGSARPLAVLLCNPLGFEEASVHRTYWHLAERLAAAGFTVLRFDHDGAGNSPTPADAPGRVRAWLGGIASACAALRAQARTERVALVGVRFGATLAMLAAREGGGVDSLVLWAPIVSVRAHVRELRAFRLLKGGKSTAALGGEEIGGYFFAKETLDGMSTLDLLASEERAAARALIVARSERAIDDERLAANLAAAGTQVKTTVDAGYSRLMRDDPYESRVPFETLDAIGAWLAEVAAAAGSAMPGAAPMLHQSPPAVSIPSTAGRPGLRETAVLFGEGARLFGIVTEAERAAAPGAARDRPVVCLLNVGSNHLAAPHRINVELAREVACLGYRAFRFDLSGLGDSGCAAGVAENRLYTLDAVADVQAAFDFLAAKYGAGRFVVVGLCSGAYVAFHAAVRDPRVVGQVLLSPYAFEWKEGDPVAPTERRAFEAFRSTRFYLQAVFDPEVWLRALRGKVHLRAIATVLLKRSVARAEEALDAGLARLHLVGRTRSGVERAFKDLSNRGVASLLVVGFEDGGLDTIGKYLGTDARRMRGRKRFKLEILDGVDHTFTTRASRERLFEILERYLATLDA